MRTIAKTAAAQGFPSNSASKQSYRVIGGVDIDGKGSKLDITDVDPFIFLDETCMRGDEAWPFPKHPHMGLISITFLLTGEIKPWDNHLGWKQNTNRAGGLYYLHSGRGIVHEEEPVVKNGPLRWLQLWLNPDIYQEQPVATAQVIQPEDVPVFEDSAAIIKVLIGSAFGKQSPLISHWPIQYLHVVLRSEQQISLPLADAAWQGFVYVLSGEAQFGASKQTGKLRDCLVLGSEGGDSLLVQNTNAAENAEFVFICGEAHQQPYYKILCGGGALIAKSAQTAREAAKNYEKAPKNFGIE